MYTLSLLIFYVFFYCLRFPSCKHFTTYFSYLCFVFPLYHHPPVFIPLSPLPSPLSRAFPHLYINLSHPCVILLRLPALYSSFFSPTFTFTFSLYFLFLFFKQSPFPPTHYLFYTYLPTLFSLS